MTEELVKSVASVVEPELRQREAVMASPMTLDRLQAERIARAVIPVVPKHVLEEAAKVAQKARESTYAGGDISQGYIAAAGDIEREIRNLGNR